MGRAQAHPLLTVALGGGLEQLANIIADTSTSLVRILSLS